MSSKGKTSNTPLLQNNEWYRLWMKTDVGSPFRTAYLTLNKEIIEKMKNINLNDSQISTKTLISSLQCAFDTIQIGMSQATINAQQIRDSIENDQENLRQQIIQQEELVHSTEKKANESRRILQNTQHQIKKLESKLQIYGREALLAENDFRRVQATLDRLHQCLHRRRRSLLHNCGWMPWGGTKNVHDRVTLYHLKSHTIQSQLVPLRRDLNLHQTSHIAAEKEWNTTRLELQTLQENYQKIQTTRKQFRNLTMEFLMIYGYLKDLASPFNPPNYQLINLFSIGSVIRPIKTIYEQLTTDQLIDPVHVEMPIENDEVLEKLGQLFDLLPEGTELDFSKSTVPCPAG